MKYPGYQVPHWVCWIAQDEDGAWWGFQVEPNQSHRSWYENEIGKCVRLGKKTHNSDWVSTIKRIK